MEPQHTKKFKKTTQNITSIKNRLAKCNPSPSTPTKNPELVNIDVLPGGTCMPVGRFLGRFPKIRENNTTQHGNSCNPIHIKNSTVCRN